MDASRTVSQLHLRFGGLESQETRGGSAGAVRVDTMIVDEAVSKRYGRTLAVDGLTFSVRPGVVTGFLGPNGAGKSTTMRMIMGLDAPTAGAITVKGRP